MHHLGGYVSYRANTTAPLFSILFNVNVTGELKIFCVCLVRIWVALYVSRIIWQQRNTTLCYNSTACYWDRPLVLLGLVRERWPGTVDVPLSPPCKLLFSTAFMFSCSAASSAYWIPWGWLSCASDGAALPNLPFYMKEGDTKKYHNRWASLAGDGEKNMLQLLVLVKPVMWANLCQN